MAKRRTFDRPPPAFQKGKQKLPSPARSTALAMLARAQGPHAQAMEATLEQDRRRGALSPLDASLAQEIARGVCRQRRWLETILDRYLRHPLPRGAHRVKDAILTGLYQHLYLDRIPPHTVVDETVRLVGVARTEASYRSLANAIMRRVVSEPKETLLPGEDVPWPVRLSVPDWLASEGGKVYPGGEAREFFAACNEPAHLTLRAVGQHGKPSLEVLEERLRGEIVDLTHAVPEIERGRFLQDCLILKSRGLSPEFLPSFRSGLVTVEDEGAQLAGCLAGAEPGMRILDLCASPGGKTAHLADLAGRQAARLVASDVSQGKLNRLQETLQRLGLADSTEMALAADVLKREEDGSFDLVLVDAPCSGLGTLRRHPEARWRGSPGDIRRLAHVQQQLLHDAARLVAPGGILAYTVCTFTLQETDQVADKFLETQAGAFNPAPAPEGLAFDESALRTAPGRWRTATHRDGCDTFFIARFQREEPG